MLMAKKTIDIETLTKIIFAECEKDGEPVSMEEAEEMAKMELGSKEMCRYEKANTPKKERKPKERKVDEEKAFILQNVKTLLKGMLLNKGEEPIVDMKTETELSFTFGGNAYTLKLTKHRPPKK
jgi:hypothetical protein